MWAAPSHGLGSKLPRHSPLLFRTLDAMTSVPSHTCQHAFSTTMHCVPSHCESKENLSSFHCVGLALFIPATRKVMHTVSKARNFSSKVWNKCKWMAGLHMKNLTEVNAKSFPIEPKLADRATEAQGIQPNFSRPFCRKLGVACQSCT